MDEVKDRHAKLLVDINGAIIKDNQDYENLIQMMTSLKHVGAGALADEKTFLKKLQLLAKRGHLGPGNYGILKGLMDKSNNIDIIKIIEEAETEIEAMKKGGGQHSRNLYPQQSSSMQGIQQNPGNNDISPEKTRKYTDASDSLTLLGADGHSYYNHQDRKGYVLILEYRGVEGVDKRTATEYDSNDLRGFFEDKLSFFVSEPRKCRDKDMDLEEFNQVMDDTRLALNGELGKQMYCFICVILSHGNQKGIHTRGGGFKTVEDIRKEFANDQIPKFTGKAKVFMIQACRGSTQQLGQTYDDSDDDVDDEDDEVRCLPRDADTLLAYATTPGCKAPRRTGGNTPWLGSWFIQMCLETFKSDHTTNHLEDMLISVREKVAELSKTNGGKAMPCVWSTLTKRLMLAKK